MDWQAQCRFIKSSIEQDIDVDEFLALDLQNDHRKFMSILISSEFDEWCHGFDKRRIR